MAKPRKCTFSRSAVLAALVAGFMAGLCFPRLDLRNQADGEPQRDITTVVLPEPLPQDQIRLELEDESSDGPQCEPAPIARPPEAVYL